MPAAAAKSTYYQLLGVPTTATAGEVRDAYRFLAKKYHPDVCKDGRKAEFFKRVTEAYNCLKDPDRRKTYDLTLLRDKIIPRHVQTMASMPIEQQMAVRQYTRVVRHLISRKIDTVEAILDLAGMFIEPKTRLSVPLPGGKRLSVTSGQLKTMLASANSLYSGIKGRRRAGR